MIKVELREKYSPSLAIGFDKIMEKRTNPLFIFDSFTPNLGKLRGKIWLWPNTNFNYKGFNVDSKIKSGWLIR